MLVTADCTRVYITILKYIFEDVLNINELINYVINS